MHKHYFIRDWMNYWYPPVLVAVLFVLSACQPGPAVHDSPTETSSPAFSATPTFSPTPTSIPTYTPEPAWYQLVDASYASLKYKYALVINPNARVYVGLADASGNTGNFGYLPNYPAYVAYTTSEAKDGRTFYLTNLGWMKDEDVQLLTPSTFSGLLLRRDIPFRFGWVLAETDSLNSSGGSIQTYQRYQVIHEVPAGNQKPGYVAIGADEWLPEESVALVSPQVPQDAGGNTCRFIYVDLAEQTLTVFDQCRLVFATLVSSGQKSWTFEGRFAILYKVEYSSITPPQTSTSEYYIEGLPYFMTYSGDFGFHAAYWHDSFGSPASHGCINLSPADGKWLYEWAGLGERVIISAGQ